MPFRREAQLRFEKKIKANRRPFIFTYHPGESRKNEAPYYNFVNSSGNPINNSKNLKLAEKPLSEDSEDSDDNEGGDNNEGDDKEKLKREQNKNNKQNIEDEDKDFDMDFDFIVDK